MTKVIDVAYGPLLKDGIVGFLLSNVKGRKLSINVYFSLCIVYTATRIIGYFPFV
jgi:hypothetical protein